MRNHLLLLLLAACHGGADTATTLPAEGLDVSELLGPGEVRAGQVASEAALFAGISAEGQVGDYKIYNDRVQFIVQGVRRGSYYEDAGGGIIDADIVRPEGQPGRDLIDEMMVMVGMGRIAVADTVEVVADGSDGSAAILRITSHGEPMTLLTGALESPDMVPDREVSIVTQLTLAPDSYLLELDTTVSWQDESTALQLGDVGMLAFDVADALHPLRGLDADLDSDGSWLGVMARQDEAALAIMSDAEPFPKSAIQDILSAVGPVLTGFQASVTLAEGDQTSSRRYLGVGPDLATLTGEWNAARGVATSPVGGLVEAGGRPVAGVRVFLTDASGDVETVATTGEDGRWAAQTALSSPTAIAVGRGPALFLDKSAGAAWTSPYASEKDAALVLASLEGGATPIPFAEGYGISEPAAATEDTTLSLVPPATLHVDTGDGRPAVVRVDFAAGDPVGADARWAPDRPGGSAAWGYAVDGAVDLSLEPGSYVVTVHRGLRWEAWQESVVLESGDSASINATLSQSVAPEGVLALDPHSHASPSGDGGIPMEDRLIVQAANGVDVHFGTDHDHVADYRPLLAPLGLDGVLQSIVADEVSPVMRGHFNAYPLEAVPGEVNNGAISWWDELVSTETLFDQIRGMAHPGDMIVQANHPAGNKGMLGLADVDVVTGEIGDPDRYTDDFDAIEVLNSGDWSEYLEYYLGIEARGLNPVAVGVSDSHSYRGVGQDLTFLQAGTSDPTALTNELLVSTMKERRTVVSHGPYINASIDGAWAPGQDVVGPVDLEVVVDGPTWMDIDAVDLLRDGLVIETVEVTDPTAVEKLRTTFRLEPEADAFYVVIARGDTPMSPVYPDQLPWAMTSAIRVDLAGDGWDSPLPSLVPAR